MVSGVPLLEVTIDGSESRKQQRFNDKQLGILKLPIYHVDDDISGIIEIKMNKLKKVEHMGVRVELLGRIGIYS